MDSIWWNELWTDWSEGPRFVGRSNVMQAHCSQENLFLTVGEPDTNIYSASTMQVVNPLIEAYKDLDLLVEPGANHCIGEKA